MRRMISVLTTLGLVLSVGTSVFAGEARPFEGETLTIAHRETSIYADALRAQFDAFEEKTGCTIEVEILAADADEAESVLLVRAATGNLPDVFSTNVGAKMQELDPAANLLDLSGYDWINNVDEQYRKIVTDKETGAIYGVPTGSSNVAGVLYNKDVFENLGLSIPKTWDEFLEVCKVIRENGIDPVECAFGLASGCQYQFLQQYFYVQSANPTFAEDYESRKIELHESPEYMRGLEKLYDLYENGYTNSDPLATGIEDAAKALADGKAAMLFNLTELISTVETVAPDAVDRIGFFPQPDVDPEMRGVTLWMPHALVVSQNTEHAELAAALLEYLTTQEAADIYCSVAVPAGVFMLNDVSVSGDSAPVIKEGQEWADIAFTPAMEYFCPIKGSNMATILSMTGTGQYTPEQAIAEIEADNAIDAQQKGIAGW